MLVQEFQEAMIHVIIWTILTFTYPPGSHIRKILQIPLWWQQHDTEAHLMPIQCITLNHTHLCLFEVYGLIPEPSCWRWFAPDEGGPIADYAGTAKMKENLSVIHLRTGSKSVWMWACYHVPRQIFKSSPSVCYCGVSAASPGPWVEPL